MILIFLVSSVLFFLVLALLNSLNSQNKVELDLSNLDKFAKQVVSKNDKFEDEILQNEFEFEKQNLTENDKSDEYKFFIIDLYRKNDYEIRLNPQDDENIDIIAYKAEEVLLIHCIDTPNSPQQDSVKAFIQSCDFYIKNNQKFLKNRQIRKIFITTCAKMDDEAGFFLQKYNAVNVAKIEYKKIEFTKEQEA